MEPQRIAVKYFAEGDLDGPTLVPVFHRWIQESRTSDRLLDVADYQHVHEGPHTVLIAHEADYVVDHGYGRPGLLYVRKRWGLSGSLRDRLQTTLRGALVGVKTLADDPQPHAPITFDTGELEIRFFDRLATPNTAEGYASVRGEVERLLDELYGGADLTLARLERDRRDPLTVKVTATPAPTVAALVERTEAATSGAG